MTDFDKLYDRSETPAEKWERPAMLEHFGREDLLPFWVADSEFKAAPEIIRHLVARAENGIYGYEYRPESLYEAITQWYEERHHWKINPSELCFSHGVMHAVTSLINQHTEQGDGIIVQPPVFFEFRIGIQASQREVVRNPLIENQGHYEMDFAGLEALASEPENKMLILCNPHNPVGRVWTSEELERVGEICLRNGVKVIADEIHADILFRGITFTPFVKAVSEDMAQQCFTCLSPAKTFNIASVTEALVIIPNRVYRERFQQYIDRFFLGKPNTFSVAAMDAAYRYSSSWLDEFLEYLASNLDYLRSFLEERIPRVKLIEPEGTFLVWLDFQELAMDAKELEVFLAQKAGIALNSGYWFGRQGAGFARMTIACPRSMLQKGLERLEEAITGFKVDEKLNDE